MTSPDPSRTALADLIAHQESVDDYITIQIPADQRDDVVAILRADDSARRTYETALEARYEELLRAPPTLNSGAGRELTDIEGKLIQQALIDSGAPQPRGELVQTDATQPTGSPNLALPRAVEGGAVTGRQGIYIASKTRHASRWLALRAAGHPIISTWIDEAGEGESADLNDLWQRCISEACLCAVLIVYREPEDALKGAWVEMGAALARGTPVFAVGLRDYTIASYSGVRHFDTVEDAFEAAALSHPNTGDGK